MCAFADLVSVYAARCGLATNPLNLNPYNGKINIPLFQIGPIEINCALEGGLGVGTNVVIITGVYEVFSFDARLG